MIESAIAQAAREQSQNLHEALEAANQKIVNLMRANDRLVAQQADSIERLKELSPVGVLHGYPVVRKEVAVRIFTIQKDY